MVASGDWADDSRNTHFRFYKLVRPIDIYIASLRYEALAGLSNESCYFHTMV